MTPQYEAAAQDIISGIKAWQMWGRSGWQEIRRRYRRTTFGPFWTTLSLGIFIVTLGFVWAHLWHQDTKTYLPFLTSGMLAWTFVSTLITDGCAVFTTAESIIKSLRFPYTILTCSVVWRNVIVFWHNFIIYIGVAYFEKVAVNWYLLLIIPGLLLISLNGLWISTLLGLLCSRFRDIQQVVTSILQVAMFVTPIFWSPKQLGPRFTHLVDFNLLYQYVNVIRAPMLGHVPSLWTYSVVAFCGVAGWVFTFFIYSKFRRRVPYWV